MRTIKSVACAGMVELLDLECTCIVAVVTGIARELRLVRIVLFVARFTVGLRDTELLGLLAFGGRLVALDARGHNMGAVESELRVSIVTTDVVLPGRPADFVVTVVTGDAAGRRLERVPVVIDVTGGAEIGDWVRVGEPLGGRSDRDTDEPLTRVSLGMTDGALDLGVLTGEGILGLRVVEIIFDRAAPDTVPTRRRMTARARTVILAPMLVVVTRFALRELERLEPDVQFALTGSRCFVAVGTFGATMTAGQSIASSSVIESFGVLPRDLRVALLTAASSELIGVGIVAHVAGQAARAETQHRAVQRSVLLFVVANIRSRDEVGFVAVPTGNFGMFCRQVEAR